ncbi:MAG: serine/threonine-protein kinase, partial [Myxococcota bacterium]
MQSKTESPAAGLLKSHLREGAATRERSIARFMAALSGVSFVIVVMIIPLIGWPLASQLLIILGSTTCYYLGLLLLIRADRFHPLMSWLNVAIEVSIPTLFFVADFYSQGPLYALTAPPLAIWGALIVVSGLRANPALAASAGLIAGLEYMAVYTLLVMPATPADVPATLTPPLMLIRALFLLCTGILTSIVARTLVRQAEAALQAVRERDVFGKYLIHERLGAGGMAEVYRATYAPEGGFQKTVAIKLIRKDKSENASFVQMFRREAELGAMLNHANIVQVLDVGAHEDELFMAMEYVDGAPLSRVAAAFAGRLPLSAVTYIASELVTALEYLHARRDHEGAPLNLVHRDVNPPNILLTKIGEVKL